MKQRDEIKPRISVAMATYNGEKYIKEQLDSLLSQTLLPFEIVVVDDCSTDNTYAILEEYAEKFPIFHIVRNEINSLPAYTFRKAFSLTTGDYIAPCDQDDVWFADKLAKCYESMTDTIDMIFHQDCIWYEDGTLKETNYPNYSLNDIIYSPRATGHTAFFRRSALEVFEWTQFITYDWALILWGLSKKSYKQIDYVGCKWRRHENALTNTVSINNHWSPKKRTKWGKLFYAMKQLLNGHHCFCIEKDMCDIETILLHYVKENPELENYVKIARCFQKQTLFSMLAAAYLNVKCTKMTSEYVKLDLLRRLARISYAFRYPFGWWLELYEYLLSINCK